MAILLDTSFLIAYHNKKDEHHKRARQIDPEDGIINDYVFNETVNLVMVRNDHRKAVDYSQFLRKALRIVRVSKPIFDEAAEKFEDHEVSFTDASIAATAEKIGINQVAAFDEDFNRFEQVERIH